MPRRARDRRTNALAVLERTLARATGDGTCIASIAPGIGIFMKCVRPCTRCTALRAEVERLKPEWEAARAQYLAEHPETRPRPKPTPAVLPEDDDDLLL